MADLAAALRSADRYLLLPVAILAARNRLTAAPAGGLSGEGNVRGAAVNLTAADLAAVRERLAGCSYLTG